MTSLSDPPCLIEHELYVENANWIRHTLSTQKCSSNERLHPRVRGVLIFSYIRRLRPFLVGSKFRISIFFGGFQKNEYYFLFFYEECLGCLKFLIFFGANGRCGARAYV